MAKFKSAYFLIAGLLFILDQTNAGRGSGRSGGRYGGGSSGTYSGGSDGVCEVGSACEQTVYIILYIFLAIVGLVVLYFIVQCIMICFESEVNMKKNKRLLDNLNQ